MNLEQMVTQFNDTYLAGKTSAKPKLPSEAEGDLLNNLIHEELMELNEAMDKHNMVEIFDALLDIIYVTAQQAVLLGYPIAEGLREVQRSNMSKLGADGKPVLREDGKVIKGVSYSPPDLVTILGEHLSKE